MTTVHESQVGEDSVEELLEELLTEVVTGTRPRPIQNENESENVAATLTDAIMASFSRTLAHASAAERKMLVDAVAPTLAEALAPALAKALAPAIVTALSHLATTDHQPREKFDEAYDQSDESYDQSDESYDEASADDKPQAESGKASGRSKRTT